MDYLQDSQFFQTVTPDAKMWRSVEVRCMVQDILGSELYSKHNSGKLGDRTIFYGITIPGENEWVRKKISDGFNQFEAKCERPVDQVDKLSCSLVNYSYPITDDQNKSCLLKVYDMKLVENLRVNDIVHVTGLVEPETFDDNSELQTNKNSQINNDASDVHQTSQHMQGTNAANGDVDENGFEPANDFPHKLVPRIHVKILKKLNHLNPLLPDIISRDTIDTTYIRLARSRLETLLTQLLGGDTLAAEYLILSLISKVQRRKDIAIGQLTLGLCGFKPEMRFLIEKLYDIISKITTHSHYIDMSITNLNKLRFTPYKDHENNKMIAGTLQLPDGLYLVLDETALTEGLLTTQGTANVGTLNNIIRWQQHNYSFKYHTVQIDTDLKILVISERKSLLSVPFTLPLAKNDSETIESMRQACESVDDFITEDLLNQFRYYITALRDVPEYNIPEDVKTAIEVEFVKRRQHDENNQRTIFSAEDLSSYMTLARYVTISSGETNLSAAAWDKVCQMESLRKERLENYGPIQD